ncbi:hypothetical protein K8Z61_06300 [Nocardioides sp. TRM66260-LWL]|uniref:SGNH hydrolase domain-containing protein n=1 Tax=Nocardioides sp. TRM66260-LWL TaxID=2874478 RepID=UPI001CC5D2AA|nr:SGNH hydrolase domain-containing protein [Nocardioides sp. TRM66260-LWL]MBZ5734102.1 hypothetical protein [Nocardioides sp. TRM66260-LWL]
MDGMERDRSDSLPAMLVGIVVLLALAAVVAGCGLAGGVDRASGPAASSDSTAPSAPAGAERRASAHPGGAALGREPETATAAFTRRADSVRPSPGTATKDRPDLYADGCQVRPESDRLTRCAYGVPASRARATIALVGDSKIGQWAPALQRLAESRALRILIMTKSGCPATDAPVTGPDGRAYTTCRTYVRKVTEELRRTRVDLVLTDSFRSDARTSGPASEDQAAMVRGLVRLWSTWQADGHRVMVVSDTPQPTKDGLLYQVPSCVKRHVADVRPCGYDRATGVRFSGRPAQQAAVAQADAVDVTPALRGRNVPGAATASLLWLDPVPWVCPARRCPPLVGDVLVYRDGSHVTRTYAHSLAPRFADALDAAGL